MTPRISRNIDHNILTRWHRYKGLDVLIKAFAEIQDRVKEARLLVVGNGDLKPEYRALSSPIAQKVIFAGNVDDDELPSYYAASDLLVLPSIEMGRNGRRIAEGHDWKQIAKKTEELYREVLADS